MNPAVEHLFDPGTSTMTYLLWDGHSPSAAVIDPVLDYDPKSGRISTESAERLLARVRSLGLQVEWILETHAHADHLSAAQWLKHQLGDKVRVGIGAGITSVQHTFQRILGLGPEFRADGSQFEHLFQDGETFMVGGVSVRVLATPGHTPDSLTFLAGDAAFIGDTLFMPDYGTARCDFPGGDARTLYRSIRTLLALPESTRIFICHDYPPGDRAPSCQTSPVAQRAGNVHIHEGVSEEEFVAIRTARDATLGKPVLLWPSIQVNIRAGSLPAPDGEGRRFLKIPLSGTVD